MHRKIAHSCTFLVSLSTAAIPTSLATPKFSDGNDIAAFVTRRHSHLRMRFNPCMGLGGRRAHGGCWVRGVHCGIGHGSGGSDLGSTQRVCQCPVVGFETVTVEVQNQSRSLQPCDDLIPLTIRQLLCLLIKS